MNFAQNVRPGDEKPHEISNDTRQLSPCVIYLVNIPLGSGGFVSQSGIACGGRPELGWPLSTYSIINKRL